MIELNFAEQLRAKKNSKVVEFANEFAEKIKPLLVCAAEEGYSKFRYGIETNSSEELSLYSDQYFIEKLSENLDGKEVNKYVQCRMTIKKRTHVRSVLSTKVN